MIWVEYILIDGVNTGPEQVEALSGLAKRLQCKVNLIPYNPVDGIELKRPSDETVGRFRDALHRKGVRVTVRIEKGTDIDAACGQLRLKSEKKTAATQALGQGGLGAGFHFDDVVGGGFLLAGRADSGVAGLGPEVGQGGCAEVAHAGFGRPRSNWPRS